MIATTTDTALGGRLPEPEEALYPEPASPSLPRRVDEVPLYSEPVQDVLGTPPRWLVRWGNTWMAVALMGLLIMSWVVRYPDVLPAPVVVTTLQAPSSVVARASGELTDILVRGNQRVRRGDLLAVVRSSANTQSVLQLQALLEPLGHSVDRMTSDPSLLKLNFPESLSLGEVQPDYSAFLHAYRALRFEWQQDPTGYELQQLEPQLAQQSNRLQSLRRQREAYVQQLALSEREWARSRELHALQMVSLRELEGKEKEVLIARQGLTGVDVEIANSQVDAGRMAQSLANLRMRRQQHRDELASNFLQAHKNLRGRIAQWERQYALRAPMDGRVSLNTPWAEHQSVQEGQTLLTIVGHDAEMDSEARNRSTSSQLIARAWLPLENSGKVQIGQEVFIRLSNYPWQEFGQLRGKVQSIALMPSETSDTAARYLVEVALPDGLETTSARQLQWRQDMQGQAFIVVEELRLIERVFYQVRKLLGGATMPSRVAS